ncbi:hypothetical protein DCAR_0313562 [Daucus carota subsp. sativus]|uniref:Uncharacterized protein n=1 Tax=Daucus carota subsp. sativus TaxID=79200 RepID=A0AAF0WRY1_DAUCS|nr:hypothetical protein DCAR_0313562 [Daucus carota subsp. sativus]
MFVMCESKALWPELVGQKGNVAAAKIQKENPRVHAIVLPEGSATTMDFRCDRVWVFVNKYGLVVAPPQIT